LFLPAQPVAAERRYLHASCLHLPAGDQVQIHAVFLVDPGYFIVFTEIINSDKFLFVILTYKSQNGRIPGIQSAHGNVAVEYAVRSTDVLQLIQRREQFALNSLGAMTVPGQIPSEIASVEIAGVCGFVRIILIGIIVQHTDLITAVDRKSTRLNSSHVSISYAVFCLKKKTHHSHVSTQCT